MKIAILMFVLACYSLVSWRIVVDKIMAGAMTQAYNVPLLHCVCTILTVLSVLAFVVVAVAAYVGEPENAAGKKKNGDENE